MHQVANNTRSDEDEPPQSVIHAPSGFGDFVSPKSAIWETRTYISLLCSRIPERQTKALASGETCEGEESLSPASENRESDELSRDIKVPISKLDVEIKRVRVD